MYLCYIYICLSCFQGKAGLMSRLFGSVDTEEVRELKILQLEQRIAQHDETVKQVDEDLK